MWCKEDFKFELVDNLLMKTDTGDYLKTFKGDSGRRITRVGSLYFAMMARCFNKEVRELHKTYLDVSCSEDFENFNTFSEFVINAPFFNAKSYDKFYALDKDLLVPGNRIYSKDTVVFLPDSINKFLSVNLRSNKGNLVGVTLNGNKYEANLSVKGRLKYLGLYPTEEKAFQAYRESKNDMARTIALLSEGAIEERATKALKNYDVKLYVKEI